MKKKFSVSINKKIEKFNKKIIIPGDKSCSIRALLLASQCIGVSKIPGSLSMRLKKRWETDRRGHKKGDLNARLYSSLYEPKEGWKIKSKDYCRWKHTTDQHRATAKKGTGGPCNKEKYPNYILKKGHNFDPEKPFKVKSVDGYAMLLNLKKLKKKNDFNFFDENFFLYLENEDLCKRLTENNENIYIFPKSKIHHLGGKAVDPKHENEIEYLRNWHWMWSKFYFNKKHYGYLIALIKVFKNLISAKIKFFYYLITLNSFKRKIYQMRLLGLISSMIGKNSYYRPKL